MGCDDLVDEDDPDAVEHRQIGRLVRGPGHLLQQRVHLVDQGATGGAGQPGDLPAQPVARPGTVRLGGDKTLVGERTHDAVHGGAGHPQFGCYLGLCHPGGPGLQEAQDVRRPVDDLDAAGPDLISVVRRHCHLADITDRRHLPAPFCV